MDAQLLKSLKSAEVVTDLDAIARRFDESVREFTSQRNGEATMHTTVEVDREQRVVRYRKNSTRPLASAVKTPAWNPQQVQALAESRGVVWQEGFGERVVPYWASDQRVDSHGDIVLQNWTFDQFETNPVMPWSHTWSALPVGVAIDWQVAQRSEADYQGPALWLLGLFATAEMSDFADRTLRMVKSGFVRAGSVGFISKKVIDVRDPEERAKLGLGTYGYLLDENSLFEFSPCTLGANAGAMTILGAAKARGQLQAEDLELMRELVRAQYARTKDVAGWQARDGELVALGRALYPKVEFAPRPKSVELPFSALEERVLRGYVPGTSTKSEPTTQEQLLARLAAIEERQLAQEQVLLGISARVEDVAQTLAAREDEPVAEPVESETESKDAAGLGAAIARVLPKLAGTTK